MVLKLSQTAKHTSQLQSIPNANAWPNVSVTLPTASLIVMPPSRLAPLCHSPDWLNNHAMQSDPNKFAINTITQLRNKRYREMRPHSQGRCFYRSQQLWIIHKKLRLLITDCYMHSAICILLHTYYYMHTATYTLLHIRFYIYAFTYTLLFYNDHLVING